MGKRDDRREAAAAIPPEDLEAEWVSDPELVERLLVAPEQRRFNPLSIALTLITIAALITGAWFAAKLTWLLVYEPPPIAVGDLPTPAPARPQQQVDVTALIDAHRSGGQRRLSNQARRPIRACPLSCRASSLRTSKRMHAPSLPAPASRKTAFV